MLSAMYPHLGPVPTHGLFVGLGVLAAVLVFVHEARRRGLWTTRRNAMAADELLREAAE